MLRVLTRAMAPILLLAGGIALLLYGTLGSSAAVVVEREERRTIEVAQPVMPPPPAPPVVFPGLPGMRQPPRPPLPAPPPIRRTVTIQVRTAVDTREPKLVREITFGGVTRLANGELKRTYSGQAPALCPT